MWKKTIILDYQSKEAIKSAQITALQKQIEYLSSNSPYYKELFEQNKIDSTSINSLSDLVQLPTTSKKDLERENKSFLCVPKNEIAEYVTTSGTLGMPITIALTKNDLRRLSYNEKRSLEIVGISAEDTIQITTTLDKMFMAGMAYYTGAISLGAAVIRSGIGNPGAQWENISRFKASVVIAVPSFLYKLASISRFDNIDPNGSTLNKAICIGEPIRNADFTPNKLHQKISNTWDIALYSTYASTEMMTAFTECNSKNGGHQIPELIILEIVDEDGNPVADGEVGEVTVTPLGVEGMPVLRYRTGDLARAHSEQCSCGRNTIRLGPVEGRKSQMIKLKGTTLYPQSIEEVLHSIDDLGSYVIELTNSSLDTDHVRVYISEAISTDLLETVKKQFSDELRVTPEIQRIPKDSLTKMLYPEGSRKPMKILDKRKSEGVT